MFAKPLTIIIATLFVTACSNPVIPGSTINTKNKDTIHTNSTAEMNEQELNQRTAIYPINLALIQQLREPVAQARSNPALEAQKRNYRYHLGTGDVLSIKLWNQPEFNNFSATTNNAIQQANQGTWVDETGHIFYPMAGKIAVKGKTLPEVQQLLTQRLSRYYKNPQVDVNISEFRSQSISVNGAVKQSGKFPINNVPMTVLDAVSLAGGFTDSADTTNIKWTRNGRDYTLSLQDLLQRGDLVQNQLLKNGDMIYIPPRSDVQVYVLGEVGKQNVLTLDNNGLNLTEALAKAEGMNQNLANSTGVFVIRNQPEHLDGKSIHVYQLNLKDATAYALGTQFKLKPNDVVYITAAPVTRWNRVLSQIMPSINSAVLLNNTFK